MHQLRVIRTFAAIVLLPLLAVVAGCAQEETATPLPASSPAPAAVSAVDDATDAASEAGAALPADTTEVALLNEVEAGWGDISGQILYDGAAPEPKVLVAKGDPAIKDAAVCAAVEQKAEDLLVDPETGGVANVFVYIFKSKAKGMKIHPEAAKLKQTEIVFDQKNCRFIPHVMVVRTGQTVLIKSDDNIAHNTHTTGILNSEFNTIIAANDRKGVPLETLKEAESLPLPVKCDIHPWMKAHWLVIDHPYATVTDKEGRFTIEKLPVGEIEFRLWHERKGYLDRKYVVTVKEGQNELEPVKFAPEMFTE